MRFVLTALIFLAGLFDAFMAMSFLLDPLRMGAGFGFTINGAQGLSAVRADFFAFFGLVAVCMLVGAWRRNGDLLLVPVALMGTAVCVRAVSLAVDGAYPGWPLPMAVELFHVAVLLVGRRVLPHHAVAEIAA